MGFAALNPSAPVDRHPLAPALAIPSLHRRPGDAERPLIIAAIFVPGVVERLAEDVLSVLRQMFRNRKWKLIVGRIGRGDYKMGTTTDDTRPHNGEPREEQVVRAIVRQLITRLPMCSVAGSKGLFGYARCTPAPRRLFVGER